MSKLFQMKVDEDIKESVDELYCSMGLDTPTAVRMFFVASLDQGGLPFEVKKPRQQPQQQKNHRRGKTLEELTRDWQGERIGEEWGGHDRGAEVVS